MFRFLQGHVLDMLAGLPDESVQCCVTSPPYWGLRDYKLPPVTWPTGWTGCHGLEPTPQLFIEHEVLIFREVRRVLRDDGVCWINLGDSFASVGKWGGSSGGKNQACKESGAYIRERKEWGTLKSKDLVGIPWAVAFALRADGWYLRSDIIWNKPNPMPESVTDRPTKSHEYLFLITKSPHYFYDAEAVKEPVNGGAHARLPGNVNPSKGAQAYADGDHRQRTKAGLLAYGKRKAAEVGSGIKNNKGFEEACSGLVSSRNKRSVWTIATEPFKGAHFATFPKALVLPCILAGTSARGCCPKCGAPWERILSEPTGGTTGKSWHDHADDAARGNDQGSHGQAVWDTYQGAKTMGWQPTCQCGETKTVPCTVLDPFLGSGTTAQVALEHGRHCIGIDLSGEYAKLIERRTDVTPGLALA